MYDNDMDVTFFLEDLNNVQHLADSLTDNQVYEKSINVLKNKPNTDEKAEQMKELVRAIHKSKKITPTQKFTLCEYLYHEGSVEVSKNSSYHEQYQDA